MKMAVAHYSNQLISVPATFSSGNTQSSIVNLANTQFGALSALALDFDSSFTTANVGVIVYRTISPIDPTPEVFYISDLTTTVPFLIPGCVARTYLGLSPWWLPSITYFALTSSVAQAATTVVKVWCQPIFQAAA